MNLSASMENPLYRLFAAACPMALQDDFGSWVTGMIRACRHATGESQITEPMLMGWVQDNHGAFLES